MEEEEINEVEIQSKSNKDDTIEIDLSSENSNVSTSQLENSQKSKSSEWKSDDLLNFHVTDTESDEEKLKKSQEKVKDKKIKNKRYIISIINLVLKFINI